MEGPLSSSSARGPKRSAVAASASAPELTGRVQSARPSKQMWYVRTVREAAQIVKDLWWFAEMAKDACSAPPPSPREVELTERFRECKPLIHDEPIWGTEAEEFDAGWAIVTPASS